MYLAFYGDLVVVVLRSGESQSRVKFAGEGKSFLARKIDLIPFPTDDGDHLVDEWPRPDLDED